MNPASAPLHCNGRPGANLLLDSGNLVYRNHNLAAGVPLHV